MGFWPVKPTSDTLTHGELGRMAPKQLHKELERIWALCEEATKAAYRQASKSGNPPVWLAIEVEGMPLKMGVFRSTLLASSRAFFYLQRDSWVNEMKPHLEGIPTPLSEKETKSTEEAFTTEKAFASFVSMVGHNNRGKRWCGPFKALILSKWQALGLESGTEGTIRFTEGFPEGQGRDLRVTVNNVAHLRKCGIEIAESSRADFDACVEAFQVPYKYGRHTGAATGVNQSGASR